MYISEFHLALPFIQLKNVTKVLKHIEVRKIKKIIIILVRETIFLASQRNNKKSSPHKKGRI